MKLTIDIDCTPQEARAFLGLPDVQKLQEKWLAEIEAKISAEAEKFQPENILQSWAAGASGNMEGMTDLFNAFVKSTRQP